MAIRSSARKRSMTETTNHAVEAPVLKKNKTTNRMSNSPASGSTSDNLNEGGTSVAPSVVSRTASTAIQVGRSTSSDRTASDDNPSPNSGGAYVMPELVEKTTEGLPASSAVPGASLLEGSRSDSRDDIVPESSGGSARLRSPFNEVNLQLNTPSTATNEQSITSPVSLQERDNNNRISALDKGKNALRAEGNDVLPVSKKHAGSNEITLDEYTGSDTEVLSTRVVSLLTAKYTKINTYAPSTLPKEMKWGLNLKHDEKDKFLCDSQNVPYTLWIVGTVSKAWFYDANGPALIPNITVFPLDEDDSVSIRRLMTKMACPPKPTIEGWGGVRASKYQGERTLHGGSAAKPFSGCFDGREVIRPKNLMDAYPLHELLPRDLVLLEAHICRYKVKNGNDRRDSTWIEWRVQLELRAVFMLAKSTMLANQNRIADEESEIYV